MSAGGVDFARDFPTLAALAAEALDPRRAGRVGHWIDACQTLATQASSAADREAIHCVLTALRALASELDLLGRRHRPRATPDRTGR